MQFNISFDLDNSPDLGGLTASERQAILDTANAAAEIWSWYLTAANITLDLRIIIDDSLFGANVLAVGGPSEFVATGSIFNGETVYESLTAAKLRTGADANGADGDMVVGLTTASIRDLLTFKTDDYAAVVPGRYDALSVFLHEIGHGLGFLYAGDDSPGIGIFDTFVVNNNFRGANAEAAAGGFVMLDRNSLSHLYELGGFGSDVMSTALDPGLNAHLSALDLAILEDIGLAIRRPTSGDDVLRPIGQATLNLGAGNDTGYALKGGSSIYGEAGNDRLIGGRSNDLLDGGNDDDYLEGRGGNDRLQGEGGQDTVAYSGLASDYLVVKGNALGSYYVTDLRNGSPDGHDELWYVERIKWGDGSITLLNRPPVVSAADMVAPSRKTLLSQLFSVSDADNDGITLYQFRDNTTSADSGYFQINGVIKPAGTVFEVTEAQLPFSYFISGRVSDDLEVRVFDGNQWNDGPGASFRLTPPPNGLPVALTGTVSPDANTRLKFGEMFYVSDPENDPIVKYQILDTGTDPASGHLEVNGVVKSAGTPFELTPAELAQTYYVSGTVNETIRVRIHDGMDWSAAADPASWAPISVSIYPYYAPGVSASNQLSHMGREIKSWNLFSARAYGNAPIVKYELLDKTTDPASGYFSINGIAKPAGVAFEVPGTDINNLSFIAGRLSDDLVVRVFDGTSWSAASITQGKQFKIISINNAPVAGTGGLITAPAGKIFDVSNIITGVDHDNDPITAYRFRKVDTDPATGYFTLGGIPQDVASVIDITAAQFSQLGYVLGSADAILNVAAYDGIDWGEARDFRINVEKPAVVPDPPAPPLVSVSGTNGKSDVLWQHDNGQVVLWRMNGAAVQASGALPQVTADWKVKEKADFNGDSKADILWQNDDGRAALWMMDGNTMLANGSGSLAVSAGSWRIRTAGDFNGDGKSDIAWQNGAGQSVIWLMNGTSIISNTGPLDTSAGGWQVVSSGDFNGDGKADLLWQSPTGQAAIWLMNGTAMQAGSGGLTNVGAEWKVKESGDFNGDGKSDILWQNNNGQAAIWLMNGTTMLGGSGALPTTGPEWQVRSTGDYNSDGKSDIAWQNTNGQGALWLMSGTSLLPGSGQMQGTGADWHLAS